MSAGFDMKMNSTKRKSLNTAEVRSFQADYATQLSNVTAQSWRTLTFPFAGYKYQARIES